MRRKYVAATTSRARSRTHVISNVATAGARKESASSGGWSSKSRGAPAPDVARKGSTAYNKAYAKNKKKGISEEEARKKASEARTKTIGYDTSKPAGNGKPGLAKPQPKAQPMRNRQKLAAKIQARGTIGIKRY